jgi:AcrR family transcriptional regulator
MHTASTETRRRRPYAARLPAAERRLQILEAALAVVGERGYRGLTMEAVAREAGVTKPVVYDAFANRDEVMITLLAEEEQRAVAEIVQAIGAVPGDAAADDPGELLIGAVRRVLETVRRRPQAYRLILLQIEGTPAVVRERIDAGRGIVTDHVQQILDWAMGPASGVDTELLALSIVALGEHAAGLLLSDPQRFSPERFEAGLRQTLQALLSPVR